MLLFCMISIQKAVLISVELRVHGGVAGVPGLEASGAGSIPVAWGKCLFTPTENP